MQGFVKVFLIRFLKFSVFIIFCFSFATGGVNAKNPKNIVVSIKPLYGLAAKITEGTPHHLKLLYDGVRSPHGASLKPSEIGEIKHADLVVWVGPAYESGLQKYLARSANLLTLSQVRGMLMLPNRFFHDHKTTENHGHDCHHHAHDDHHPCHHDHSPNAMDGHMWLHPHNASMILRSLASTLSISNPKYEKQYKNNLQRALVDVRLAFLILKKRVKPRVYLSFHDFSQYFDRAFGSQCVGVVTQDPHLPLSLKHLADLKAQIKKEKIDFLITEPQFKADILKKLSRKGVPIKTLDYLGTSLKANTFVYEEILKSLAKSFY